MNSRKCETPGCGNQVSSGTCDDCKLAAEQEDARISTWALMGYPRFRRLLAAHAAFDAWLADHGLMGQPAPEP